MTAQGISISNWLSRNTIRPLMITSVLFVVAMIFMVYTIMVTKKIEYEESAQRLLSMAELATLQKNRPFVESLVELGKKDFDLSALSICSNSKPLFLYPDTRQHCELTPKLWQTSITHFLPGTEKSSIEAVIPRFPGWELGLWGALVALFFVATSSIIFRRIGAKLREQVLVPILAGVKNEDLINQLINDIKITELSDIFGAYQQKICELRELGVLNAKYAEDVAIAKTTQTLAHDLKNPLSLFEFAMNAETAEDFKRSKKSMERAFERIHSIIGNIGQKSTGLTIKRVASELNIEGICSQFNLTHGKLGVKVSIVGPSNIEANFDKTAIERCLVNLVANAIEAGASRVNLETRINGRDLTIEVKDNGPGVSPELLPKLFARGSTFGKEHGEGIGLYNVKSIIEAHGGEVAYSRDNLESIFKLTLPDILIPNVSEPSEIKLLQEVMIIPDKQEPTTNRPQILLYLSDTNRSTELTAALQNFAVDICLDPAISQHPVLVYTDNISATSQLVTKGVKLCLDSSSTPIESAVRQITLMLQSINNLDLKGPT